MEFLADPHIWLSFLTLFLMEIVLGIDNVIFISILAGGLPEHQQRKERLLGLGLALVIRITLLVFIGWIMTLTVPLFNPSEWVGIEQGGWHERLSLSGRDLILITGGLFLIFKSTKEINESLEGAGKTHQVKPSTLGKTVVQIGLMDLVLGIDSVITAVGMADHISVMIAAIIVAMIFMLVASKGLSGFVAQHPSVKYLRLLFY